MPKVVLDSLPATEATTALLWEACRREPDVATIQRAAGGDVRPSLLVALAVTNRIGPLLWRSLVQAGCQDSLGDQRGVLEELANVFRLQELLLHPRAVAMALGPLDSAGLEPVVMKGPAVARHYPEPGLRPMDDLDLLLPRGRHNDAVRVLEDAGWTVSRPRGRHQYDTQLRHPDVPSMPLELHYGLEGWYERSNRLRPVWLWERRVPIDCMGTKGWGLPVEEEVLSLAAHAGKPYHGFDRLVWLADLAMVIGHAQEGDGINWDRLAALAEQTQCVTVLSAGLLMAARMGLSLPGGTFTLPEEGWRAAPLGRLLRDDWPVSHFEGGTFHMRFALVDTNWRRLVLFAGSPYKASWAERLQWPVRTATRTFELWREARHHSVRD